MVKIIISILYPFFRRKKETFSPEKIKNILIITTTAIGDTLMCTPAIRAIRKNFPQAFIADLVHIRRKEILEDNPYLDKIILYYGKWKKTLQLISSLKKEHFDLIIILHANDPDIIPIAFLSKPKFLVGWKESKLSYLLDMKAEHEKSGFHFIERRFEFLKTIGIKDNKDYKKDIFIPEEKIKKCNDFLKEKRVRDKELIIIFHPGASVSTRRWPANRFNDLGDMISKNYKAKIIIIGGKDLEAKGSYIFRSMQQKPINVAGLFNLKETAALLKRADLLVTTDSGPAHLAAALEIPSVILFGPVSKIAAGPLLSSDNCILIEKDIPCQRPCKLKKCRKKKHLCMELITVEEVFAAVKKLLSKKIG
jgi:lipopolysaccharide heptosyltransferase II